MMFIAVNSDIAFLAAHELILDPVYSAADHLLISTTKVPVGLPFSLFRAIRSTSGAVRRITFDPIRKRTNSAPDYIQVTCSGRIYTATDQFFIRTKSDPLQLSLSLLLLLSKIIVRSLSIAPLW